MTYTELLAKLTLANTEVKILREACPATHGGEAYDAVRKAEERVRRIMKEIRAAFASEEKSDETA